MLYANAIFWYILENWKAIKPSNCFEIMYGLKKGKIRMWLEFKQLLLKFDNNILK